jgi:hypothetical protein
MVEGFFTISEEFLDAADYEYPSVAFCAIWYPPLWTGEEECAECSTRTVASPE